MAQNIRTLLPQTPSCIKAIRFTAENRRQSGESRREGEGKEEKNGETGEGMDFARSCKYSCGRPRLQQKTVLHISWLVTKLRCTSLTVNQHLPLNASITVAQKVVNWLISTSPYDQNLTLLTSENFLKENSTRSCDNTHKLSMYSSKRYTGNI